MKKITQNDSIVKVKVLLRSEVLDNFKETISISTFINNLLLIQEMAEKETLNFNDVNTIISTLKESKFKKINRL